MDVLFSKPCHITKPFSHSIVQLVEYPLMAIQFGVPLQMKVWPFDSLLVTQHHLSNKGWIALISKGEQLWNSKVDKLFHRNKQYSMSKMHKDTVLWPIEINALCWKCTDTVLKHKCRNTMLICCNHGTAEKTTETRQGVLSAVPMSSHYKTLDYTT